MRSADVIILVIFHYLISYVGIVVVVVVVVVVISFTYSLKSCQRESNNDL